MTPTKQIAEEVIEKLGVKEVDCHPDHKNHDLCIHQYFPILIGDVLEAAKDITGLKYDGTKQTHDACCKCHCDCPDYFATEIIIEHWQLCGFTKSLQEILAEAEIEEHETQDKDGKIDIQFRLTGPAADLFNLLHNIFITTE